MSYNMIFSSHIADGHVLNDDVTYITTADTGILEWQARRLAESIATYAPESELVIFVPESSLPKLSPKTREVFEHHSTVLTGEIPIPEYPISALLQAYVKGAHVAETEYIAALDTDTLVLEPIRLTSGGEVWLRPADVGVQYWTSDRSVGQWKRLYREFNLTAPSRKEWLVSTVDRNPIPPYWNSGVVVTTDRTLPERWLDITRELYERDDLPVDGSEFFLDQISLALAVRQNDVGQLSEVANFPLGGRVRTPADVQVLHYGNSRNLARVLSPSVRRKLRELDALSTVTPSELGRSVLDVMSTQSGRLLEYEQKEHVRNILSTLYLT